MTEPPGKRPRVLPTKPQKTILTTENEVIIQYVEPSGELKGQQLTVPLGTTKEELRAVLNEMRDAEEHQEYSFTIHDKSAIEISSNLLDAFLQLKKPSSENTIQVHYFPLALFRVRPVTRLSASLEASKDAVLALSFAGDGCGLATAGGDTAVRFWDLLTQTPLHVCKGHTHWVLCVAWSAMGNVTATAGMDSKIRVWDPKTGKEKREPLSGHKKPVVDLRWQPLHFVDDDSNAPLLMSGSKDYSIRIWDTERGVSLCTLSGHTQMVTGVRWCSSHRSYVYSTSRDTTFKVWNWKNGSLWRELKVHAHWINHISSNTEYAVRTGAFDPLTDPSNFSRSELCAAAKRRVDDVLEKSVGERVLTCSDDQTVTLWRPMKSKTPVARMPGHQAPVNRVSFSPDGRLIASCSFDKSIRLYSAISGHFMHSFRGHVGRVFCLDWSPDSRFIVSGSADSTVKVWDVGNRKLKEDLPGHADEVYAVEWSPDGSTVASGGKDGVLKLWRH